MINTPSNSPIKNVGVLEYTIAKNIILNTCNVVKLIF